MPSSSTWLAFSLCLAPVSHSKRDKLRKSTYTSTITGTPRKEEKASTAAATADDDDDEDYCSGDNGMCATLNTQATAQYGNAIREKWQEIRQKITCALGENHSSASSSSSSISLLFCQSSSTISWSDCRDEQTTASSSTIHCFSHEQLT